MRRHVLCLLLLALAFLQPAAGLALEATQVQQNILHAVVGDDEAVTSAHIEPLHKSAHLNDANIAIW